MENRFLLPSGGFVGPLPYTQLPEQPAFKTWRVDWTGWDVPRIWDIVRADKYETGFEQVRGFAQLSQLLYEYYKQLRLRRNDIANAWESPVAELLLTRMDGFAGSLLSEANCARTTASGLHGILETFVKAKAEVGKLHDDWNRVTGDWVPEWWDNAAADLNTKAQEIMRKTDDAVSDYRKQIIVPRPFDPSIGGAPPPPPPPEGEEPDVGPVVPPIPGYRPVIGEVPEFGPELEGLVQAQAASVPRFVDAVPGTPVSMLPIPPGSPYAPFGGAYVLPGPGVGRAGYVVPMPPPGGGSGRAGGGTLMRPSAAPAGAGGAVAGMMPMPMGPMGPAGGPGHGSHIYRRRSETWEVAKGVPPLIEPVDDDTFVPDRPSPKQEEAFHDWFTDLAYPWRKETNDGAKVIFRKVDE